MEPPYVIKPVNQGSSVGVYHHPSRATTVRPEELRSAKWDLGDEVMVEEYVPGRELTVAVMGNEGAGGHRDHAEDRSSSTTTKRNMPPGGSEHVVPAKLSRRGDRGSDAARRARA